LVLGAVVEDGADRQIQVLLCERALWPGEANALPPVGRELIGGMDGMGDAWYYYYHALGVWRRGWCFVGGDGDEQIGGASTEQRLPSCVQQKKSDEKREQTAYNTRVCSLA
jgi:hypothetical protein